MTEKVKKYLEQLLLKEYRKDRIELKEGEKDLPRLLPIDVFGFNVSANRLFVGPCIENVAPNYARIMKGGFEEVKKQVEESIKNNTDEEKREFGREMLREIDSALEVCDRFRESIEDKNERLNEALIRIPRKGAESFFEACLFLKICIYLLRRCGVNHLGLGRFDQYMYPYYLKDLSNGVSKDEIFETLELFFISLNYDSDIYIGVQQGDNGQSLMLGGFDKDGNSTYNELSELCMKASLELSLIDPKINLRVGKNTPIEQYILGTELTKKGLGFPQYCNDDVVIPGLVKLGYSLEDALDYTVAACWEFIIPNVGTDTPNRNAFNFPIVLSEVVRTKLESCDTFDEFLKAVDEKIIFCCDEIVAYNYPELFAGPFDSIFIDNSIEALTPAYKASKYHNYGCHGVGIANAADSLAAIKKLVYDEKSLSAATLIEALDKNFEGFEELRTELITCPKMGNNDDFVDSIASHLMDAFSENMNGHKTPFGGIWRAGTGTAMEYIRSSVICPATPDGRLSGEPYSANFSPSLLVKPSGLLSVIQSFTKHDMTNIINGGPLTLEIHPSLLRNDVGVEKTAMLVKTFIDLGGHQLQLNSANREILLDAQKNPEKYPNLIVRVWGWSGYFNELDLSYQNHIISRQEYTH